MSKRCKITLRIIAVVILVMTVIISSDIFINRKKGILSNIEFSGAYSDCNNKLLQIFLTSDETYRVYTSIDEYPEDFLEMLLLQEDRRFYHHIGINPLSILRAFGSTYIKHTRVIGASTITMQVAKLKYHIYTKNIPGKLKQIYYALRLELLYSKKDILEAYINLAPCGRNIEGFTAASFYFFNKNINKLDLSQKLMLCVLPQNPTKRCPSLTNIPDDLMDARKRLYDSWIEYHPMDREYENFINIAPTLVCKYDQLCPHFTRMLELERSEKSFYGKNGIVKTTLDLDMNNQVEYILKQYISKNRHIGINNASALLLDSSTMEIKSYIGSAGFYDNTILGQVDANISKRSPGSTLKPFIYAMAMEQGYIHYDTMLKDTQSAFSEYTPDNYGNTFKGPIKAWNALTQSRNIPAVSLARKIKNPDLYDFLVKAGVSELKEKDTYGLSIVLGSADVTPMELVSMYSVFLNDGVQYPIYKTYPHNIKTNLDGNTLLTKESAFITYKMLEQNPSPIEFRSRDVRNFSVPYKTGTSIGFRDCWSVGMFGQYVLCVWIGNFDGVGNNSFLGRSAAAPLFFNIADNLIAQGYVKKVELEVPEGVVQIDVCSVSGQLCNDDCPETEKTWFIPGVSPITKCKIHRRINIDTRTGYRTDEKEGEYVKSVVREFWPSDLMDLFAKAGLPRLVPPDYPPQKEITRNTDLGFPPEIISPLNFTEYMFTPDKPDRNVIILNATADADCTELFWFAGSTFIARTAPGQKFEWRPTAGSYELSVLDNKGRSSSRKVKINYAF